MAWPKWKTEVFELFTSGKISYETYRELVTGSAQNYKSWTKERNGITPKQTKPQAQTKQPDPAHKATDKQLQTLEKKIDREYKTAVAEMEKKLQAYRDQYNAAYLKALDRLNKGEITQKEYEDWARRHMAQDQHLQDMTNVLSKDMHNANTMAHRIARDGMPDVYALNGNYATYMIEQSGKIDTGFTLYNHDAAESLLREKRQLMPGPSAKKAQEIAQNKDMQWNKSKIQSACLQSVLQGESPYDLAERLRGIATMNENASIRYARTMTTSVQNSGRYDAFKRAKGLGVDLICEWNAILDNATRHDHRQLHGQRREVGEPFEVDGIKIYYPAQSDGPGASDIPQRMIWNCRCTIIAWVKGFEGDTVKHNEAMGNKTFDQWQTEKAPKKKQSAAQKNTTNDQDSLTSTPQPFMVSLDAFRKTKGTTGDFQKKAAEALQQSQHEEAKRVFSQYADQIEVQDGQHTGTAFFTADTAHYKGIGVYLSESRTRRGDYIHEPMQTFFHESGHMIDWLAGGKSGVRLSEKPNSQGITLIQAMQGDLARFKTTMGAKSDQSLIDMLKREQMASREKGNISDALGGLTGIAYPLGIGHKASYYTTAKTQREFFAEVLDSAAANEASYQQMRRVFPTAVDWVWDMLGVKTP